MLSHSTCIEGMPGTDKAQCVLSPPLSLVRSSSRCLRWHPAHSLALCPAMLGISQLFTLLPSPHFSHNLHQRGRGTAGECAGYTALHFPSSSKFAQKAEGDLVTVQSLILLQESNLKKVKMCLNMVVRFIPKGPCLQEYCTSFLFFF